MFKLAEPVLERAQILPVAPPRLPANVQVMAVAEYSAPTISAARLLTYDPGVGRHVLDIGKGELLAVRTSDVSAVYRS